MTVDRTISDDLAALRAVDDHDVLALAHVGALGAQAPTVSRPEELPHVGLLVGGATSLAYSIAVLAVSLYVKATFWWTWSDWTDFRVGTLATLATAVTAAGYTLGRLIRTRRFETAALAFAVAGWSAVVIVLGRLVLTERLNYQWVINLHDIADATLADSAIAVAATTVLAGAARARDVARVAAIPARDRDARHRSRHHDTHDRLGL